MRFRIRRGCDLRLGDEPTGPVTTVDDAHEVAVCGADFGYSHAALRVSEGDRVRPLFADRRHPAIQVVAPASGRIRKILRGPRRRLDAIVIDVDDEPPVGFPAAGSQGIAGLESADIRERLLAAGLWTAFRGRPFDRVPPPDLVPRAVFVTAIDSQPGAPDPFLAIDAAADDFAAGVAAVAAICDGDTWVCTRADRSPPLPDAAAVRHATFDGPHPAGLPGTHIHAVGVAVAGIPDVWHIGYQDVIAIGGLLLRGELSHRRLVAIGGTAAAPPRVHRTRAGVRLDVLCPGESQDPSTRLLSGSLLDGRATPDYLGRYHNQLTALPVRQPSFATWRRALRLLLAGGPGIAGPAEFGGRGRSTAMLPVTDYEQVWPFSVPPAVLLRALLTGDVDAVQALGCAGLAEDDVALLAYVCPGNNDYGQALRKVLHVLEQAS